jgi:hypothetical protein
MLLVMALMIAMCHVLIDTFENSRFVLFFEGGGVMLPPLGMMWLLVDVAEWRNFSDLPADPKRCVALLLLNRLDFLKADVRHRHKVAAGSTGVVRVSFFYVCAPQIFAVLQKLILALQEMPIQIGSLPRAFIDSCVAQLTALL